MIDFSYVKTDYSKRLEDIRQAHMIEHMDRQAEVAEAIPEVEELQKQIISYWMKLYIWRFFIMRLCGRYLKKVSI